MILDYDDVEPSTIPAAAVPSTSHSTQSIPTLKAEVVPTKPQKRGGIATGPTRRPGCAADLKAAISKHLEKTMLHFEKASLKESPSVRDEQRTHTVPTEVVKTPPFIPVSVVKNMRRREDARVPARQTPEPLGASKRPQPSFSAHRNGGGPPQNKLFSMALKGALADGVETGRAASQRPTPVTSQKVEPIAATQVDVRSLQTPPDCVLPNGSGNHFDRVINDEPDTHDAVRPVRQAEEGRANIGASIRPPLFDSHVHLDRMSQMGIDFKWFERLRASGTHEFLGCVVNFCDPPNFDEASKSYNIREILSAIPTDMRPLVSITVGCHPQHAGIFDTVEAYMKRLFDTLWPSLEEWPVVAVGECGLDSGWLHRASQTQQEYAFRAQIRFAIDSNLPIVLHIRDNNGEVTMDRRALEILREENLPQNHPIHRHCYDKGSADARIWTAEFSNIAFGVTGLLLSNVPDLQEFVGGLSGRGMLLLETDSPYFKKKNRIPCNTPESIAVIARKVAELQGRHADDVMRECTQTARNLYRIQYPRCS